MNVYQLMPTPCYEDDDDDDDDGGGMLDNFWDSDGRPNHGIQ